jgi:DNA mismatch repair protein MutS
MYLQTDEQTISDLRIFDTQHAGGIYDLYNAAHTRGGAELLNTLFRNPLSDQQIINQRSNTIRHFAKLNIAFPFSAASFDVAEKYLMNNTEQNTAQGSHNTMLGEKEMHNGVAAVIDIFGVAKAFIENTDVIHIEAYQAERDNMSALLYDQAFKPVVCTKSSGKLPFSAVTAYDSLFRTKEYAKVKRLLEHIYLLDVYLSVAKIAAQRKYVFPKALEKGLCSLTLTGVYYPELKNPVGNSFSMESGQNVVFLTGANMAGKSTFLRSVSIALYVAHLGFPVAAESMTFSVMDGIYTTINLPDKLGIGASHFYVEVLRLRKVAAELGAGKSLFVSFDELFRGTNVKDAHEATVAVTSAFAKKKTSMFIISSHIVEAAEMLRQETGIGFRYLPTIMNGTTPRYTYKLAEGVTDDRHGMVIINNEGILDILKNGVRKRENQLI